MSAVLEQLEIGDDVEIKGPIGSFIWTGNGAYKWKGRQGYARKIGMICGGSGKPRSPINLRHCADSNDSIRNHTNLSGSTWHFR